MRGIGFIYFDELIKSDKMEFRSCLVRRWEDKKLFE